MGLTRRYAEGKKKTEREKERWEGHVCVHVVTHHHQVRWEGGTYRRRVFKEYIDNLCETECVCVYVRLCL